MTKEESEQREAPASTSGHMLEICLFLVVLLATAAFTLQRGFRSSDAEALSPSTIAPSTASSEPEPAAAPAKAVVASSSEATRPDNAVPVIAGEPSPFVVQGAPYLFEPAVFDIDNDQKLTFAISGMPSWAVFEPSTGALMGVPQEEDVGLYDGIVLSVSDGRDTADLGPFSIEVMPAAGGTALIEWTPPSDTVDGSPFPGISGYRIEYGQSPNALLQTVNVESPGVASYLVDNLAPGSWYFRVVAYDVEGLETKPTPTVEKIVQ